MKIRILSEQKAVDMQRGDAYMTQISEGLLGKRSVLWVCCYVCSYRMMMTRHNVITNKDGTITLEGISDSSTIKCPSCDAYYYIKNSDIVPIEPQ